MCNVTHTDILAGFQTDRYHSMVTIQIALHTNPRGPGFWKLNTSFLSETEYINQIKTTIEGVKDEYQLVNVSLLWEMIKLKQEPINRSLHMHCILESTFARIFLFLELPFLQEAQFYRENLSQSSSLEESSDLPAITVTRRDHFM